MEFKFPKALMVNGDEWKVEFVAGLQLSGVQVLGACCESSRTISIEKYLDHQEKIVTLAHEILHAWSFSYEFPLTHRVINKLEKPLAEFISTMSFLY